VQDEPAQQLVDSLASEGCPKPHYIHCDITDLDALKAAVHQVLATHATIDVLVNNAANDQRHSIEEVTPDFWEHSLATNLRPHFSIINMSSIAWMIPNLNMPIYNTAKAAIVGLTRAFAHECGASNIRVNAVLPGAIATERQRRLWYTPEYLENIRSRQALPHQIEPEEVARLILFLAADDSSAITNQSYVVDAGFV
jgi:NAD(P)-dependent dehydrogenase (short-subunit alcohol dehydrogenase family)